MLTFLTNEWNSDMNLQSFHLCLLTLMLELQWMLDWDRPCVTFTSPTADGAQRLVRDRGDDVSLSLKGSGWWHELMTIQSGTSLLQDVENRVSAATFQHLELARPWFWKSWQNYAEGRWHSEPSFPRKLMELECKLRQKYSTTVVDLGFTPAGISERWGKVVQAE